MRVSQVVTILLVIASAYVSAQLASIARLASGAGSGRGNRRVYLLRWYWWRINAWSEISAMACSLAMTVAINAMHPFHGSAPVLFAKTALTTTAITSLVWVAVTLLTPAEPKEKLEGFYRLVRPDVRGWKPVAAGLGANAAPPTRDLGSNLMAWALGCAMVYLCLFGTGKLLLHEPALGATLLVVSALCAVALYRNFVAGFREEPES